jgi:hypothetical protein
MRLGVYIRQSRGYVERLIFCFGLLGHVELVYRAEQKLPNVLLSIYPPSPPPLFPLFPPSCISQCREHIP